MGTAPFFCTSELPAPRQFQPPPTNPYSRPLCRWLRDLDKRAVMPEAARCPYIATEVSAVVLLALEAGELAVLRVVLVHMAAQGCVSVFGLRCERPFFWAVHGPLSLRHVTLEHASCNRKGRLRAPACWHRFRTRIYDKPLQIVYPLFLVACQHRYRLHVKYAATICARLAVAEPSHLCCLVYRCSCLP